MIPPLPSEPMTEAYMLALLEQMSLSYPMANACRTLMDIHKDRTFAEVLFRAFCVLLEQNNFLLNKVCKAEMRLPQIISFNKEVAYDPPASDS